MDATAPIIEIKNLSFSYAGKTVLKNIYFAINRGETWSIMGKNGAGKSTFIKCIAGLLPVNPGTIFINGKDILKLKPRERAKVISYVPQANARGLAPYIVSDYVMLGRFPYQGLLAIPNETDRKIVAEALRLTDTADLRDRLMTTLSGGELQRVFLAGAVAQQTGILLLDEPATFLDPLHQEMIRKTLDRIHAELGTIIITITHEVNVAITRFKKVLALIEGSIYYAGPADIFKEKCPDILNEIFSIRFESSRCLSSNRTILVPGEII